MDPIRFVRKNFVPHKQIMERAGMSEVEIYHSDSVLAGRCFHQRHPDDLSFPTKKHV